MQQVIKTFSVSNILDFDQKALEIFEQLKYQKITLATMDLRIGLIALSQSLILLTRNRKDFNKVPHLIIQDWTV